MLIAMVARSMTTQASRFHSSTPIPTRRWCRVGSSRAARPMPAIVARTACSHGVSLMQPYYFRFVRRQDVIRVSANFWHFGSCGAGFWLRSLVAIFQFPFRGCTVYPRAAHCCTKATYARTARNRLDGRVRPTRFAPRPAAMLVLGEVGRQH